MSSGAGDAAGHVAGPYYAEAWRRDAERAKSRSREPPPPPGALWGANALARRLFRTRTVTELEAVLSAGAGAGGADAGAGGGAPAAASAATAARPPLSLGDAPPVAWSSDTLLRVLMRVRDWQAVHLLTALGDDGTPPPWEARCVLAESRHYTAAAAALTRSGGDARAALLLLATARKRGVLPCASFAAAAVAAAGAAGGAVGARQALEAVEGAWQRGAPKSNAVEALRDARPHAAFIRALVADSRADVSAAQALGAMPAGSEPREGVVGSSFAAALVHLQSMRGSYGAEADAGVFTALLGGADTTAELASVRSAMDELGVAGGVDEQLCCAELAAAGRAAAGDSTARRELASGAQQRLRRAGLMPTVGTFNTLIAQCAACGDSEGVATTLADMFDAGLEPDVRTFNALIDAARRKGADDGSEGISDELRSLRDEMNAIGVSPNAETFRRLLVACAEHRKWSDALGILDDMATEKITPGGQTYDVLFRALAKAERSRVRHVEGADTGSAEGAADLQQVRKELMGRLHHDGHDLDGDGRVRASRGDVARSRVHGRRRRKPMGP